MLYVTCIIVHSKLRFSNPTRRTSTCMLLIHFKQNVFLNKNASLPETLLRKFETALWSVSSKVQSSKPPCLTAQPKWPSFLVPGTKKQEHRRNRQTVDASQVFSQGEHRNFQTRHWRPAARRAVTVKGRNFPSLFLPLSRHLPLPAYLSELPSPPASPLALRTVVFPHGSSLFLQQAPPMELRRRRRRAVPASQAVAVGYAVSLQVLVFSIDWLTVVSWSCADWDFVVSFGFAGRWGERGWRRRRSGCLGSEGSWSRSSWACCFLSLGQCCGEWWGLGQIKALTFLQKSGWLLLGSDSRSLGVLKPCLFGWSL